MKPVLAFAMGVVVASGIAYLAMGGKQEQKPAAAQTAAAVQQPQTYPQTNPDQAAVPSPDQTAKPAPAPPPAQPAAEVKPAPAEPKRISSTSRRSALGRNAEHKITSTTTTAHIQEPVKQPEAAPQQQVAQNTPPPAPVQPVTQVPVVREEPKAVEPPKPEPHSVTINPGTMLSVRLEEALSTDRSFQGDQFRASLAAPLVVNGFVLAERGARVMGRVAEIDKGGRVKGVAHLGLELTSLTTSDGQRIALRTERFSKQADTTHGRDAAKIGGGAALGAIIGAIAGGGKGAAIGAGVGGAAGAGDVALTRGKAAELPVESKLTFRLAEPVTVTEKLNY